MCTPTVRLQIIELAAGGVPWKEHLYELEKQEGLEGAIKFCLYEVPPAPDLRDPSCLLSGVSQCCLAVRCCPRLSCKTAACYCPGSCNTACCS
jgi:hypothetical protein